MLEFQTNRKRSCLYKSMGVSKINFSEQKDFKTDFRVFFFFFLCAKRLFGKEVYKVKVCGKTTCQNGDLFQNFFIGYAF